MEQLLLANSSTIQSTVAGCIYIQKYTWNSPLYTHIFLFNKTKRGIDCSGVRGHTNVLDVCVPLEVIVGGAVVRSVEAIDGPLRLTQLRQVLHLRLFPSHLRGWGLSCCSENIFKKCDLIRSFSILLYRYGQTLERDQGFLMYIHVY